MTIIEMPWGRVRNPPPIPNELTTSNLVDLDELAFAELVQAHLVPRDQGGAGRRQWDRFWKLLREDEDLADRTYNVLECFLDDTEEALRSGDLDENATKRAEKFAGQCEMSWKRIDRGRDRTGALAWAGEQADVHPAHSRRVIGALIGAIARHRSDTLRIVGKPSSADAELWDVMAHLGLDPRDHDTR